MICQFSFKNFRSYKDETVLDFQATAIPEFKDSLIYDDDKVSLLPVEVVYGPNGGGKTNLLLALSGIYCFKTYIRYGKSQSNTHYPGDG